MQLSFSVTNQSLTRLGSFRPVEETVNYLTCLFTFNTTARDKAKALHILSGSVALLRHPYERSPHSGAGNCWCGSDQRSKIHDVVLDP